MGKVGRPSGALNKATRDGREFAARIVDSPKFRETLRLQAEAGTLHPSIVNTLLHYRYGKPKETVEIVNVDESMTGKPLDEMTASELAEEATLLAARVLEAAEQDVQEEPVIVSRRNPSDIPMFGIGEPASSDEEVH